MAIWLDNAVWHNLQKGWTDARTLAKDDYIDLTGCKLRLQQWNKCARILLLNAQAKYTQLRFAATPVAATLARSQL
jgi:hypothetical protein